jgi:hypothetical protein
MALSGVNPSCCSFGWFTMIGFPPNLTGCEGHCNKRASADDVPKELEAASDAALLTFTK